MKFFKDHKILVSSVLVIIAFIGYSFLTGNEEEDALVSEVIVERTPAMVAEEELLSLLIELQSLSLNGSIFSSEVFMGLTDFGQTLIPQAVGRSNPFAPIGVGAPPIDE